MSDRTAAVILEDTISLQREEWMREIQAILDQGTDSATVVTMGECPHTGAVLHDVIETTEE